MNKAPIILLTLPVILFSSCDDRLETRIKPAPEANKAPAWHIPPPESFAKPDNETALGEFLESWERLGLPVRPVNTAQLLSLFTSLSPETRFYCEEIARLNRDELEKANPDPALYLHFAHVVLKVREEKDGFSNEKDRLFAFWCACGGFQHKDSDQMTSRAARMYVLDND